jgi:hypothetical protein
MSNPTSWTSITRTYSLLVTDANGCSDNDDMTLNVGEQPVAEAGVNKFKCFELTETIGGSPTASGGTPPYTYSWTPKTGLDDHTSANPVSSSTITVNYSVKVTDSFGCTNEDLMTLTVGFQLFADAGLDTGVCTGSSMTIGGSPTAKGGSPPYTYQWSPATGLNSTTVANPVSTPTANTTYFVTVTDANGCSKVDSMTLLVVPYPIVDAGPDTVNCIGMSMVIGGSPTATNGTPSYSYMWSGYRFVRFNYS